jgi:hypothetical protein
MNEAYRFMVWLISAGLVTIAFVADSEVAALETKIDSLTVRCAEIEQTLAVDTVSYVYPVIVFDGSVKVQSRVIFEQPVTFDSTVIFRDSVAFGYGGVSFVEPPTAAYD